MASQPTPEDLADDNVNNLAQTEDEPLNEIDKLRAKLRERTERLKAARQQRMAENQSELSTSEQPTPLDNSTETIEQPSTFEQTAFSEPLADETAIRTDSDTATNALVIEDVIEPQTEEDLLRQKLAAAQMEIATDDNAEQVEPNEDTISAETLQTIEEPLVEEAQSVESFDSLATDDAADVEEIAIGDEENDFVVEEIELISDENDLAEFTSPQELEDEPSQPNEAAISSGGEKRSSVADEWVAELLNEEESIAEVSIDELEIEPLSEQTETVEEMSTDLSVEDALPESTEILAAEAEAEAEAEVALLPEEDSKPRDIDSTKAELDFAAALEAEKAQAELDRKQTLSEIAVFDIPEQPDLPEPEQLESLLKDVEQLQASQPAEPASLIPPTQQAPLPDPAQLDNLLNEVDKLTSAKKPVKSKKKRSELQAILSTIPSFSGSKKTKYK
ncbi:hypothetical protein A9E74_00519 [Methylophaga muralis]|uniref:Uncharacterized protein n=2 Tax=Methylophaga muralis TaxID=291169 RepID=A0A1E3GUF0_9GAMM|nr:hypothetical protein A9E74_00519 [Methylophaga muralis]